jgi:hypothetical protein
VRGRHGRGERGRERGRRGPTGERDPHGRTGRDAQERDGDHDREAGAGGDAQQRRRRDRVARRALQQDPGHGQAHPGDQPCDRPRETQLGDDVVRVERARAGQRVQHVADRQRDGPDGDADHHDGGQHPGRDAGRPEATGHDAGWSRK